MKKANKGSFTVGRNLKDMTGRRFGRLLVTKRDGTYLKNRLAVWLCQCDCGNVTSVRGASLRKGTSKSCGCLSKEMTSERTKLPEGESSFNALYGSYQRNAEKRGWNFNLSKAFFRQLVVQPCYYCGGRPSNISKCNKSTNGVFVYNGLDRVQNEIGYVPDNVVPCCRRCNYVKATLSVSELVTHCKKIVNCNEQRKLKIRSKNYVCRE